MALSLRNRLLASYLLLLLVSLGGIFGAFLVLSSVVPAPPQQTYSRLAGIMQILNRPNFEQDYGFPDVPGAGRRDPDEIYDEFAQDVDVRIMRIDIRRNIIVYDSANLLEGAQPQISLETERSGQLPPGIADINGRFIHEGQEWLFSGKVIGGLDPNLATVAADLPPSTSMQRVLSDYGAALLVPVTQAGLIGLVIALVMAGFVSRTIAGPLQKVGEAATAVAAGDLDQQVPISGPPEVRAVAEAFNYMSAAVLATQQAQQDFMANVSHDLKTPLTSIQGYSQAIIDGTARQPGHAASVIYEEAERLNRMVVQLTDLARMRAGQFAMHKSPLELNQIVETVVQNLSVVTQKKDQTLRLRTAPVGTVNGDGDLLVQVLNNLIGNAIKYTPEGGRIEVRTRMRQQQVEISIADNGIGIPKDDLPRIFERFYQVDKTRGPKRGTGLGLAITREIIQAHDGDITVDSALDRGTTFTVHLPLADAVPALNGHNHRHT